MISLFPSAMASATAAARQKALENIDPAGLRRFFTGAGYILYGLLFGLYWRTHPPVTTYGALLTLAAVLAIPYLGEKLFERLQAYIVYRRTGYVAIEGRIEPRAEISPYLNALVILLLITWILGATLFFFDSSKWIFLSIGAYDVAKSCGSAPSKWLRHLAIAGCAAVALIASLTFAERFGIFMCGLGAIKIVDGVIALVLYLRRNPVASVPQA